MKYLPFIAICFMIACVPDQPTMQVATPSEEITAPAPVAPSATMSRTLTPLFSDLITIRGVHIQDKSDVGFRGESALPDGTCILTQLYEDDRPLDWWPSERCALVKDGRWEIQVRLSEEQGAPEDLSETAMYILRAWQKDDPAIEAQYFPFDLQGPPPESTLRTPLPTQSTSEPAKPAPGQDWLLYISSMEPIPLRS